MATYVMFSVPGHGHVNPTLALAQELVARGEQVIYYLTEQFRPAVEATGATFRSFGEETFWGPLASGQFPVSGKKADMRLLLSGMIKTQIQASTSMLPQLIEDLRAAQVDCILYDTMFLSATLLSQILHLPAVALYSSYVSNEHFNRRQFQSALSRFMPQREQFMQTMASLNEDLAKLYKSYNLEPPTDMRSFRQEARDLNIVFLPRAFQPAGETFDERFVFVGPSLQTQRHYSGDFPLEHLGKHPQLYISLGTAFNNQPDFYNLCFDAFGQTGWQVILASGSRVDRSALKEIPANFSVASHLPQLQVLAQTDVFVSHGGMNSTMESLAFGVPLVIIPQMIEQEMTGRRVQELGLGLTLDMDTLTIDRLRAAVEQVTHDAAIRTKLQEMQREIRESGGYRRAADAIIAYTQSGK